TARSAPAGAKTCRTVGSPAPARGYGPGASGTPSRPAGRPAATRGNSQSSAVVPRRTTAPARDKTAGGSACPRARAARGRELRGPQLVVGRHDERRIAAVGHTIG